jgi:hypothetical protein
MGTVYGDGKSCGIFTNMPTAAVGLIAACQLPLKCNFKNWHVAEKINN